MPSDLEPNLAAPPSLGPLSSLPRRLGRRALKLLRPLAVPFLHRLDVRIRWAVDRTATAHTVHAIAEASQINHVQSSAAIDRLRAELLSSFSELQADLMLRLDAMALSYLRSHTFAAQLSALEIRLEEGRQSTQTALLANLVGQRAMLDRLVQDRSTADALEMLVARTDYLLQRRWVQLGNEIAVRTDSGFLLVPIEDQALLLAMVESAGRLEPGTLAVMLALLRPGDFMLDVGANIGTLSLPAARRVGPSGRILAIEPTPRAATVLQRSLALNAVDDRVDVLQCAAGDADETGRLSLCANTTHNTIGVSTEATDSIDVPVRKLDSCVASGAVVNLVKLDVEGAELQAFRGMERIIADSPDIAVIVEFGPSHLERGKVSVAQWFETMLAPGFTAWEIDEMTGHLRPLRGDGLADVFSINLLLLRQDPASRPELRLA